MSKVIVRENEPFEGVIRRFKRFTERNGISHSLRDKEFYEKSTEEHKHMKAAAVKRHDKAKLASALPKKLF